MAKSRNKDKEDPAKDYLDPSVTVPFDNLAPKLGDSGESFSVSGTGGSDDIAYQLAALNEKLAKLNEKMEKILILAETIAAEGVIWRFD